MSRPSIFLATVPFVLVLVLATAGPAAAATAPTITSPSTDSLATGTPSFSWTSGAEGEQPTSIAIGKSSAVDATGALASTEGGMVLTVPAGATTIAARRPLHAGTWWWTSAWQSPSTASLPQSGVTAPASFVVPAYLRTLRGAFTQFGASTAFRARGSLASNARAVVVTCSVHVGAKLVARSRTKITPRTTGRTGFSCPRLTVPESLDGRRLTLRVVARGAGLTSRATSSFVAI